MKKNIYNKVKTLVIGLAAATVAAGTFTSCNDFLDIEAHDLVTLENYWKEKADVTSAIASCSSGMETYAVISRMMIWGEFRSENITDNSPTTEDKDADLSRLLKENITASNGYTYWGDFYTVINRCNTVLQYAPQVAASDPAYTQDQLNANIAEVTALRALCYFYLIRTFRDVPYTSEAYIDDTKEQNLAQTPFNAVLDSCIASLEDVKDMALKKYPESDMAAYNTSRVTQNFIYALLCDMYLWKQDYDNCIKYANLIVSSKLQDAKDNKYSESDFANFAGYPLIDSYNRGDYGNDFNKIFVDGNSMESIFELYFDGDSYNLWNGPVSNFYGAENSNPPYVMPTTYVSQLSSGLPSTLVHGDRSKGYDGRLFENIVYDMEGNAKYINKYTAANSLTLQSSNKPYQNAMYGARYGVYGSSYASRNNSNYIIYRLSDIMLLKAEAFALKISTDGQIEEGTQDYNYLDSAFTIVQAVNNRALLEYPTKSHSLDISDYTSKTLILNEVYQERNRELMFEGKRYFDLVRRAMRENDTKYLRENVSNKNSSTASFVKDKLQRMDAIFWPVNLDELKANPNLQQNSAFGSGENNSYTNSAN